MFATFADPKTAFVFKRIFGADERKPLLNDLLELEARGAFASSSISP